MGLSLKAISEALPLDTRRRVEIDISEPLGMEAGKAVLVFEEPDVPRLFAISQDAAALKRQYPEWPESLRLLVSLLGVSYAGERDAGDPPPGIFFANLAATNRAAWAYLANEYAAAFPDVSGTSASDSDADPNA